MTKPAKKAAPRKRKTPVQTLGYGLSPPKPTAEDITRAVAPPPTADLVGAATPIGWNTTAVGLYGLGCFLFGVFFAGFVIGMGWVHV